MKALHACIDIGGTKLAVSMADAQSAQTRALYHRLAEPSAKTGSNAALSAQIIRLIHESARRMCGKSYEIKSIGISSCGPFLMQNGLIELSTPNLCGGLAGAARGLPNDWLSIPLQAPLQSAFAQIAHAIRIENDCIGALEAERRWGALQGVANCAYVTWSTGIGMGLCVDGRVLRGKNGNAGHAGHSFVSSADSEALCGCGNLGDLESLVAGNAIPRRFASLGYADATSLFIAAPACSAGENGLFDTQKQLQTAEKRSAADIVNELCETMGKALYNLIVTLDLERISIGGSVFWNNQATLLPKLRQVISGKLPALTAGCEIVPAGLGLEVGDLGALALTQVAQ